MMRSIAAAALLAAALTPPGWAVDIVGRVVEDHSGEALASARVRILRVGQRTLAADRDTDRDGRFSALELPEGDYRLEVSKSNYAGVSLAAPASGPATVRLVKLGVISGRVLDGEAKPISGASIFPQLEDAKTGLPPSPRGSQSTDASGEYRLHGLLPGRYSLVVSLARLQSSAAGAMVYPSNANPESLTVSGGDEYRNIDFVFPVASFHAVYGKVQLPEDGGKYAATLVSLERPDLAVAMTQTEDGGSFRFDSVPAGSYRLLVSGPATAYGGRGVWLGAAAQYGATDIDVLGQDVSGVTVGVAPGRSVRVMLASEAPLPAGACPAEAPLRLTPLEDRGATLLLETRISFTEPQLLEGLAPGRYHVTLGDLGESCFLAQNPVVDLESIEDSELVRVMTAPAGWIVGGLVGPAAGSGYAVILAPTFASALDAAPEDLRIAFADEEGRFGFDALAPGRYRIAAQLRGDAEARLVPADLSKMFEIDVAGGVATEVDLPARAN